MSNDSMFTIGADGIDVAKLVEDIRKTVAEKRAKGLYADPRIARAERTNLAQLKNDAEFMSLYMECLRDAVNIDINDFPIVERRGRFSKLLVLFKKIIWKLLKFYTYRLWSQQNQANDLLLSAIEDTQAKYAGKIKDLEERIARLEAAGK